MFTTNNSYFENVCLFRNSNLKEIEAYLKLSKDKEAGGVLLKDGTFQVLRNTSHQHDILSFSDKNWEYIKNTPNILCIIHSHYLFTHSSYLTLPDIFVSHHLDIPVASFHIETGVWDFYDNNCPHPYPLRLDDYSNIDLQDINFYKNWEYEPYRCDCYSIVASYFLGKYDIKLQNVVRSEKDFGDERGESWNRFIEEAWHNNFMIRNDTSKPQIGDVILLRLNGTISHCGVLVNSLHSKNNFLHLLGGKRKSEVISLASLKKSIAAYYFHIEVDKVAVKI